MYNISNGKTHLVYLLVFATTKNIETTLYNQIEFLTSDN